MSQDEQLRLQRLVAIERTARERVDYLTSRFHSLRLQLSDCESKLGEARAELAAAEKLVAEQRARS